MNGTIKHRYLMAAGGLMFAVASLVSTVTPAAAQTPPHTTCSVDGIGEQGPAIRMRRDVGVRTSPDFTGVTLEPGQTGRVSSSGSVSPGRNMADVGPEGLAAAPAPDDDDWPMPGAPRYGVYALILELDDDELDVTEHKVWVGADSGCFTYQGRSPGLLALGINDDSALDNRGDFEAVIDLYPMP